MILTCPHCANEVFVSKGGACPACGGDPRVRSPHARIAVRSQDVLPAFCLVCGDASARTVEVQQRRRGDQQALRRSDAEFVRVGAAISFLFAPLFLAFARFMDLFMMPTQRIAVRVPLCQRCEPPVPSKVDWEAGKLYFTVPFEVAAVFEATRKAR